MIIQRTIEESVLASIYNTGFKGFDFLQNLKMPIGHGCVLCFHKSLIPFNREIDLVPIGYI